MEARDLVASRSSPPQEHLPGPPASPRFGCAVGVVELVEPDRIQVVATRLEILVARAGTRHLTQRQSWQRVAQQILRISVGMEELEELVT